VNLIMDFFIGEFFIIKVWERKNVNVQKKKKRHNN
jgi:hypothetical protein